MPYRNNNFLLNRLQPDALNRITSQLSLLELSHGQVLAESDQRIDKVYFPHSGVISCIVELRSGDAIETGMIGKDGAFGAGDAFDGRISTNRAVVQAAGVASIISSDRLAGIASEFPALKNLLFDYEHFLFVQVAANGCLQRSSRRPRPHVQMAVADARACRTRNTADAGVLGSNDWGPAHQRDRRCERIAGGGINHLQAGPHSD